MNFYSIVLNNPFTVKLLIKHGNLTGNADHSMEMYDILDGNIILQMNLLLVSNLVLILWNQIHITGMMNRSHHQSNES